MKAYILTRGTHKDYRYLGPVPTEWWQALLDWTSVDRPASLARGSGHDLGLVLAGIPSGRRDGFGRSIRFTLVLEAGEADSDQCGNLVRASLSESGRAELGRALDEALPATEVDDLLAGSSTMPDLDRRVQDALVKALAGQEPAVGTAPASDAGLWVGSVGDPAADNAFVARVLALAGGETGYAATLNLVRSIERANVIAERLGQSVALLLPEGLVEGVQPLLGKAPTPPGDKTTIPRWVKIVVIALSAGALAFLIRWLIGRG